MKKKKKMSSKWLEDAIMSLVKARLIDKISCWRSSMAKKNID
jgi:hypothetical protein